MGKPIQRPEWLNETDPLKDFINQLPGGPQTVPDYTTMQSIKYHQAKKASAAASTARAARTAETDVRRRRIPGDPQLGQRAEYSLTNATSFKTPSRIVLGGSKSSPVLRDWLKSLVMNSKFNVQFACDWKSDPNKRTISWHCYRHNMCSWKRTFGLNASNYNSASNAAYNTEPQKALAGYVVNAAWPQWMDPFDPTTVSDWVGEGSTDPASNGVYTNLPYRNFMLRPDNNTVTAGTNIQNATTTGDVNGGYVATQSVSSPFIPQLHNRIYYAPVNISDIEDECFRNNRIVNESQFEYLVDTATVENSLVTNAHRCVSSIGQQNVRYSIDDTTAPYVSIAPPAVSSGIVGDNASRNQYKNLVQKGNVNYKFINKADGPCKIEVIVWKFKSTHVSPPCYAKNENGPTSTVWADTTDSRYYMQYGDSSIPVTAPVSNAAAAGTPQPVCNAIQSTLDRYNEAYFLAVTQRFAQDNMSGRVPTNEDLFSNPNFPLFKKYSKYFQESLCDFTEHSRYTYPLQAGQRQEVNIKLPGEHYNPCSVGKEFGLNTSQAPGATNVVAPGDGTWGLPGFSSQYGENPINPFNKFTYFVMIATSGCNMSAAYEKGIDGNSYGAEGAILNTQKGPDTIEVGTAWSASHVQAYCTYSEDVGAASTKISRRSMYNLGGLVEPDTTGDSTGPVLSKPVDVYNLSIGPRIPLERIIRLPPQVTVNRISEGNTTSSAYPTKQTSSSGNQAKTEPASGTNL